MKFKTSLNFSRKLKIKQKILIFLFPIYPIKAFKSIALISIISSLIALRVILGLIHIYIPQFVMSISVGTIGLMVLSWFFGPVIGFFCGFITDTLSYFISSGGVWFWLYAIQEPLLALLFGSISSVYLLRKNATNQIIDKIVIRIIIYSFAVFSIVILLSLNSDNFVFLGDKFKDFNAQFFSVYKYLLSCLIIFFILVYEILNIFIEKKKKVNSLFLIYILFAIIMYSIIFSFILGTFSAIKYYEYLHKTPSPMFIKYGAFGLLIVRILKESFMVPIRFVLLSSVLFVSIPIFSKILNNYTLSWKINYNDVSKNNKIIYL